MLAYSRRFIYAYLSIVGCTKACYEIATIANVAFVSCLAEDEARGGESSKSTKHGIEREAMFGQ